MSTSIKLRKIAEEIRIAMAYDRETYRQNLADSLYGPLTHFYYVRLAEKNKKGLESVVTCWRNEIDTLLKAFMIVVQHPIRGFKNRRKALEQAIAEIKSRDNNARRQAREKFMECFSTKIKRGITGEDTTEFWANEVFPRVEFALKDA
jgi:hypothetical protein